MRGAILVLAACSAPVKPAPPVAAPAPQRDLAIAEPVKPAPPAPAPRLQRRDNLVFASRDVPELQRRAQPGSEIAVAERDLWSPCVRDFVAMQPPATRRALTAAFARYPTSCDPEKGIVLDAPRESRERYLVFRGPLAAMALDVVTCGAPSDGTVTIRYDGRRWTGLATTTQLGACTTASVPDMPSLRRVLREVVDARDATVQDLVVTDDTKRDLRLVLDALDALSAR